MAFLVEQELSQETVPVAIKPTPGFCIKSTTSDSGSYTYRNAASDTSTNNNAAAALTALSALSSQSSSSNPNLLPIPRGIKVFLNIAWDPNVPAPPPTNEASIRRAMAGGDLDDVVAGRYYVPVVVSEPRTVTDKAGKPSLVFDCVFSASLKSRCTKDKEFRLYLIELALEHVEEKTSVTLSRQVGTPNIASKGTIEARTVLIPKSLLHQSQNGGSTTKDEPLLREASTSSLKSQKLATPGLDTSPAAAASDKPRPKPILKKQISTATTVATTITNDANKTSTKSTTNPEPSSKRPLIEELTSVETQSSVHPVGRVSQTTSASASASASVDTTTTRSRPSSNNNSNNAHSHMIVATDAKTKSNVDSVLGNSDIAALSVLPAPRWTWSSADGDRLRIEVDLPSLTHTLHARSTLDLEARRLLLHIPDTYFLDVNLALSDAEIGRINSFRIDDDDNGAIGGGAKKAVTGTEALKTRGHNAGQALRLKRGRDFDVEGARAEWRVKEGKLVVFV